MFHIMTEAKAEDDTVIVATFEDGSKRRYDMKWLIDSHKAFVPLKDCKLFSKLYVDQGGYGIVWNDNIDISAEEIWVNGEIC